MEYQIYAPGRTELAGNHTDHQNGRILAAAVNRGLTARVEPNGTNKVRIQSVGFADFEIDLAHLAVNPRNFGTSKALATGVLASFKELGLSVGGFDASVTSSIGAGSGLSSSAAFTVLIGRILNRLFNDDKVEPIVLAHIGRTAENEYFGKPCGLMDQLSCSLGTTVYVDFKTGEIQHIDADFSRMGLTLCLTDTGGSHAGLDTSYARISDDMKLIAGMFDKELLCDVDPAEFRAKGWSEEDRHVRRAMHFFDENDRVPLMRDAIIRRDGGTYMRLMNESGRSSERLLNNIVTSASGDTKLREGLDLSAEILDGKGAWRVHGGGFAGCVQALMPAVFFPEYKEKMEKRFGAGSCSEISLLK